MDKTDPIAARARELYSQFCIGQYAGHIGIDEEQFVSVITTALQAERERAIEDAAQCAVHANQYWPALRESGRDTAIRIEQAIRGLAAKKEK